MARQNRRDSVRPTVRRAWTNEMLELLGTMSDQEVAKRVGVTDSAVNIKRRTLGILSYGKSTQANKHPWSKKELAMLGKLSDAQVARNIGLSAGVVAAKRRSLGRPIAGGKTSRQRLWTKKEIAKLGKISDVEFSKQFRINRRQVKEKRYELEIPAFQLNPEIRQWDTAMLRDIPKLSISNFAKKYGITHARVLAQRIRLGILTREPRSRWTAEMESELLNSGIPEFATKYGMSPQAAYAKRGKLTRATKK